MTTPTLVGVYGAKSTGTTSTSVPGVLVDDWLVAVQEVDYVPAAALVPPTGSGSGAWAEIGSVAGAIADCNVKLRSWRKVATSAGTHTVTVTQGSNSSGNHLIVLHLRGVTGVDGVPTVGQGTTGTAFTATSITTSTPDALLVWAGAGIQFSGTLTITAPAGMVERDEEAVNTSAALAVATQALAGDGATGARSGTGSRSASSGWCAKLFALSGPPSLIERSSTDSGSGTDAAAGTAAAAAADTGSGVDDVAVTRIEHRPVTDSGSGADTVEMTVPVAKPSPDTGAGADTAAVQRASSPADTGAGADATTVTRSSTVAQAGAAAETVRAGPRLTDTATGVDSVHVVDIPYTAPVILRQGTVYEVVVVARIPAMSGPPTLLEVDPIRWSTLALVDTLSKPQQLSVTCLAPTLPESIKQRLRSPARNATELRLIRNGLTVFAGPLRGARISRESKILTLEARGVLDYTAAWTVLADKRFAQADQFAMVAWMLDQWQAIPFGHHGIDTSQVGASGVLRDGTYLRAETHNVLARATELGERQHGFDIGVDPATRQLQLWSPGKGVDRSVGEDAIVFDDRNITDGDVLISLGIDDVATDSIGTAGSAGSDKLLYSIWTNDELAALYGRSSVTRSYSTGIEEQGTLDAHTAAAGQARSDALIVPGPGLRITPDADVTAYADGDTVAYTPSDVLGLVGAWRIRSRKITAESKTGDERASVEFV